jgi:hypothetical protein
MRDSFTEANPPATGPLAVHPENPRYFADAAGKPVYLVGSHPWANFQDIGFEGDKPFDYDRYLEFMREYRFNFMRFWSWEHAAWATWTPEKVIVGPMPYARTGPGFALDGKPKFDLTRFDEAYFDRMRARLIQARDSGIYAAIMLFQAFSGLWPSTIWPFSAAHRGDPFQGHYYNKSNNIQGFDGDQDANSILDIGEPEVREYQAAYIRKVIDTVNDLDNVLYEVINEGGNDDWDRFVVETVRGYEKGLPKQHPIGITGHGGVYLAGMLASAAEWISPGAHDLLEFGDVQVDPPAWDGRKVSVLDTDHIWGHGIDYKWVWKSFLRGHHVLFMDPWGPLAGWYNPLRNRPDYPGYEEARKAMRNTVHYARRLNLGAAVPRPDLASTRFCLADPGKAYLVYLPDGGEVTVDLTPAPDGLTVEWMDPIQGKIVPGKLVSGGAQQTFRPPFPNDAVLYLGAG